MVTKVMFLQASVILSMGGGGCLPQCMLGYHTPPPLEQTPQSRHPPEQTPPSEQTHTPPGADTPLGADTPPQEQTPLGADTHPRADTPPPKAGSSIWSMSGRYASYWNAILFKVDFQPTYCMGSTKFPKVMFLQVSVCPRAGMRGCSWGACMVAPRGGLGMHGCSGGWCMAKGACVAKGGMHGKGGHVWQKGGHAW